MGKQFLYGNFYKRIRRTVIVEIVLMGSKLKFLILVLFYAMQDKAMMNNFVLPCNDVYYPLRYIYIFRDCWYFFLETNCSYLNCSIIIFFFNKLYAEKMVEFCFCPKRQIHFKKTIYLNCFLSSMFFYSLLNHKNKWV